MRVQEIAYHRNGVSGEPFYAVTFTDDDGRHMLAAIFDYQERDSYEPHYPACPRTAVFDRDLLAHGEIRFAHNSWRGDRYDRWLRRAIARHERAEAQAHAEAVA